MPWNKGLTKETDTRIKKVSERNSILWKTDPQRFEERNRKISEKKKGKPPWNKGLKIGKQSSELIKRRTQTSKNKRSMINYYKTKHPFLFIVDKVRENKDKFIEVQCKKCKNFFIPKPTQIHERIRAIEIPGGFEENNFYCSSQCKNTCDVYRKRTNPVIKGKTYTQYEFQIFREFVLERDKYICQFCGESATDVHHEKSQKLEPFFALDPDYAWGCCEKCHYEKGHKGECSTGGLANQICL